MCASYVMKAQCSSVDIMYYIPYGSLPVNGCDLYDILITFKFADCTKVIINLNNPAINFNAKMPVKLWKFSV